MVPDLLLHLFAIHVLLLSGHVLLLLRNYRPLPTENRVFRWKSIRIRYSHPYLDHDFLSGAFRMRLALESWFKEILPLQQHRSAGSKLHAPPKCLDHC